MDYYKRFAILFMILIFTLALIFSSSLSLLSTFAFYIFLYAIFFMPTNFFSQKLKKYLVLFICGIFIVFNFSISFIIYDNLLEIIIYNLKTVFPIIPIKFPM